MKHIINCPYSQAHQLINLAEEHGEQGAEAKEALFRATYEEGSNVSDDQVLHQASTSRWKLLGTILRLAPRLIHTVLISVGMKHEAASQKCKDIAGYRPFRAKSAAGKSFFAQAI